MRTWLFSPPEVSLRVRLARATEIFSVWVHLDFHRLFGPLTNVVTRPTASSGRGRSRPGHHVMMIPLLAAAIVEADKR